MIQIGEVQGQKRSQSFEEKMLNFMSENKRILNLHEQKFSKLVFFQANTIVFQAKKKCLFEKPGNLSRAAGPFDAESV